MLIFGVFALLSIFGASGLIIFKNPVHSALCLLLTFFSMAAIYTMLEAPVLAVFQVAVYAGAILVLFIFVVMFLNLDQEGQYHKHELRRLGLVLAGVLSSVGITLWGLSHMPLSNGRPMPDHQAKRLAELLLTKHVFVFELISFLLVAAAIGAVALNRRSE